MLGEIKGNRFVGSSFRALQRTIGGFCREVVSPRRTLTSTIKRDQAFDRKC